MSNINPRDLSEMGKLLEIGYISKAHGVKGEVVLVLTSDRPEHLDTGRVVFLTKPPGPQSRVSRVGPDDSLMEVVVQQASQVPSKGQSWVDTTHWIVKFAGIDTRNQAEALRQHRVLAKKIEDSSVLWVDDMIGAEVVDSTGTSRGKVVAVEANPASDLLVLESKCLVPVVFVTCFPDERGRILVDAPEGLFEIAT